MATERFNRKVVLSGTEVEYYKYKTKLQIRGYKRKKRKEKIKVEVSPEKQAETNLEKTRFSINRTRTQIRRIIKCNPDLNKFLTLTSTMTDIKKSNRFFNLFTQKMNVQYPNFKYIAVTEFQKDIDYFGKIKPDGGALHYHVVYNLPYADQNKIAEIWGQGHIKLERKEGKKVIAYISKYLEKEMKDPRMLHKKKYFCSRNLERPVEIVGKQAIDFMAKNDSLQFKKKMKFENEYAGKVEYKDFELKS